MRHWLGKLDRIFRMVLCAVLPRSLWLNRKTRAGVVITGRNRPGHGGRGFFIFGEALERELEDLDRFLRKGDVLIDVGANTGVFSMKAARCVEQDGIVIAIEPQPDMVYALYRNVALNGFANVRIRNLCVNAKSGTAELWINQRRPASASLLRHDERAAGLSCLCLTLDELVRLEQLPRVDYVKIDTEGTEADVLRGAQQVIQQFKPVVQVEVSIRDVAAMSGYERWQYPGSMNALLVPRDNWMTQVCARLGYQMQPA